MEKQENVVEQKYPFWNVDQVGASKNFGQDLPNNEIGLWIIWL